MQLANQEAQRFNHEYIAPEHILLGLIKEGSGVAANVLKNLDVDLRKIRVGVESRIRPGPDMVTMGKLPQTPNARLVIENAVREARGLNHGHIGTEHILLGLLHDDIAFAVLDDMGLTKEKVREQIKAIVGTQSTPPDGASAQPSVPANSPEGYPWQWSIAGHGDNVTSYVVSGFIPERIRRLLPPDPKECPFKPGDKVMLNSGGPTMTVIDVGTHTRQVFCQWVNTYGKTETGGFPAETLTKQ